MTSQPPTEPPTSGPAVEVPPHGEVRPKVTIYQHPRPSLWVYWPDRWQTADVRARHDYPGGGVAYQVECSLWDDTGSPSRVSRTFAWGPDSIRPA